MKAMKEFSIGFMTDTHVGETRESCARVEGAYRIFRREGCEVIVNAGDIADRFCPAGYRHYREIADKTFPDPASRPKEIFVYANHDTVGFPRKPGEDRSVAFPEVRRLLGIRHDLYARIDHRGYAFVVVPETLDYGRYERMIAEACAESPGRRVFLCDHRPGGGTTPMSATFGDLDGRRRPILDKYPQVVALNGHVHGSIRDPRQIWHGTYTCVNAGCLEGWRGNYFGTAPAAKREYGVFVIDVHPDKLEFRRFDVRTGEPFDAEPMDAPERVRGELWRRDDSGAWAVFAVKDAEYPFFLPPAERKPVERIDFHPACFDEGVPYRITLTPIDFAGRRGATRVVEEGVGRAAPGGTVVFESARPMDDMPFLYGLDGGGPVPRDSGGFYAFSGADARLLFPKGTWDGPAGTRFRYVIDMATEQGDGRSWSMTMRNPRPLTNGHSRLFTFPGKQGTMRYAVDFVKADDAYDFYLLFREAPSGRIRFDRIRVERLER